MKSLLIISIANPITIGLYEDNELIDTIQEEGMTSDILPLIMEDILKKHTLDELIYVNGPGSYMAIKIAYIFLKTISITKKIPLKAIEGFYFNDNAPIKALGKKYFVKKDDQISIDFIDDQTKLKDFSLPKTLQNLKFDKDELPKYHLPAV